MPIFTNWLGPTATPRSVVEATPELWSVASAPEATPCAEPIAVVVAVAELATENIRDAALEVPVVILRDALIRVDVALNGLAILHTTNDGAVGTTERTPMIFVLRAPMVCEFGPNPMPWVILT